MSRVLQRMNDSATGVQLAVSTGFSETKVSRIKNDQLEDSVLLLAHLGYKVVASDQKCVLRLLTNSWSSRIGVWLSARLSLYGMRRSNGWQKFAKSFSPEVHRWRGVGSSAEAELGVMTEMAGR